MRKIRKSLHSNKKLIFRKFSRKSFAAFNSLHKVVHIGTLAATYSLIVSPLQVHAQTDTITFSKVVDMEEVEIVGQKSPTLFEELPRMVSIITQKEIESAPSQSISDLLRYTSNIDVRQRGKSGIQSDISIRGGSFDQTMILFNGVSISDPQTGHLGLILPIDIEAINRVEVLNGPAAQLYGANAFSGAINFISIPAELNSAKITAAYGEYGFFSTSATVNLAEKHFRNLLFFSNSKSDGYASNTDFQKTNFYYQGQVLTKEGDFDVQFGYSDRAFGANGFYTPKYPDQFEENQMTFGSLSFKSGSKIKSQSKVYWRRLRDRFELFREDNKWYRIQNGITISNDTFRTAYDTITWYKQHNHHINDVYGMDFSLETMTKIGVTSLGWHLRSENIISNNIGYNRSSLIPVRGYDSTFYTKSDSRAVFDLYAEQTINLKPFFIAAIASINWNSFSPDEIHFLPGIDLRFDLTRQLSAIASYNYTIGLPTFTDLHYKDPNNQGNLDLKAYTQNSVECGLRWVYDANMITSSCFFNFGKGIIDWVWFSDRDIFRPINIDNFSARGIEISSLHNFTKQFGADFPIQDLRINYTFMDVKKDIPGNVSKYSNAKQMLSAMLQIRIVRGLIFAGNFSYLERQGSYITYDFNSKNYIENPFHPYWLVDTRLTYNFKLYSIYAEATNLFNKKYVDVGSILQPGRWITAGVKFEINDF
jgi:vitamin B12 transporter